MALRERIGLSNVTVRNHLRVDDSNEDPLLGLYLDAACDEVELYIGTDFDPDPVPSLVQLGVLRTLAGFYEWRDTETKSERLGDETKTRITLPESVRNELWPYRINPGF